MPPVTRISAAPFFIKQLDSFVTAIELIANVLVAQVGVLRMSLYVQETVKRKNAIVSKHLF